MSINNIHFQVFVEVGAFFFGHFIRLLFRLYSLAHFKFFSHTKCFLGKISCSHTLKILLILFISCSFFLFFTMCTSQRRHTSTRFRGGKKYSKKKSCIKSTTPVNELVFLNIHIIITFIISVFLLFGTQAFGNHSKSRKSDFLANYFFFFFLVFGSFKIS